jgi:hypothetical protein
MTRSLHLVPAADDFATDVVPLFELDDTVEFPVVPPVPAPRPRRCRTERPRVVRERGWVAGLLLAAVLMYLLVVVPALPSLVGVR